MKVFLLDNYDSFTYNLLQYLEELGASVQVVRNDRIEIGNLLAGGWDRIILSPGPGRPERAGIMPALIEALARDASSRHAGARDALARDAGARDSKAVPLFGVCLGHQAIGQAFGAAVVEAPTLMHGKTSAIHHSGAGVFKNLPSPFEATRYHSLAVAADSIPDCLEVTARTAEGVVMGLRHRTHPIEGVQFHPESILTQFGRQLLWNFLVGEAA